MKTSRSDPKEDAARLLAGLRQLKNDRGAMADLRCGLNPVKLPRTWPLLARFGGIGNPQIETVAALFAYHPEETQTGNLGTTCRQLSGKYQTFDNRFRRLLACDRDEICTHIRAIVLAARSKGIPLNYEELFADLCYWSDNVKVRWAREYWSATESDELAASGNTEAAP